MKYEVIEFFTTPGQLRSIADKLEAQIKIARVGDNLPSYGARVSPETEIKFTIDQDLVRLLK